MLIRLTIRGTVLINDVPHQIREMVIEGVSTDGVGKGSFTAYPLDAPFFDENGQEVTEGGVKIVFESTLAMNPKDLKGLVQVLTTG